MKRFPTELTLLRILPILAIACFIVLAYDLIPLDSAGDPTIFGKTFVFIAAVLTLSIPICFVGYCLAALFSRAIREEIRRHKWLDALWAATTVLIFLSLTISGHGNPNSRGMRTARTRIELAQVYTAILAYETEYGAEPTTSNNPDIVEILEGKNERKIEFISFSRWELDPKGEVIDAWGTPLRVSFLDPKNPLVQSAGPDKVWDTADDLTGENYP